MIWFYLKPRFSAALLPENNASIRFSSFHSVMVKNKYIEFIISVIYEFHISLMTRKQGRVQIGYVIILAMIGMRVFFVMSNIR